MTVEVGSKAPEFTLKNQDGQEVSLSDFRGKQAVLLVFYPFAFSGICTGELCSARDDLGSFQNDDVQILGISVDTTWSLKAWATQEGYHFPLLSDFWPHGAVPRATASSPPTWASPSAAPSSSTPRASCGSPSTTAPATPATSRAGRTRSRSSRLRPDGLVRAFPCWSTGTHAGTVAGA